MRHALLLAVLASSPALSTPPKTDDLPTALRDWERWVLHDEKDRTCPFLHGTRDRPCAWPGQLTLTLDEQGGRFTQSIKTYREAWQRLPGESRHWPQDVQVDGKAAVVVADGSGRPAVLLGAGEHSVAGQFTWGSLPDALDIPPDTGLVALTVKGKPVELPNRDAEGRVFLQRERSQEESDRVELDVYRLVTDEIPLVLTTSLTLKVSGRSRELLLGRSLPEGFVPMSLSSTLPARLEPDGRLRLQVRPGTWTVELTARSPGPVTSLRRPQPDGPWTEGDEVWVFDARPSLRQVLIDGLTAVDPTQTSLPTAWRAFPAYSVGAEDELTLSERRRGDSEPAPDMLTLNRTLWLDFSGDGYTVSDRIEGQLHRSWRLEVQPGTELGRVVASGADQSITRLEAQGPAGVELRQGALALEADSRMPREGGSLSAVSWDADFNRVSATLQLPPGWKLVAARGADSVPGTWVDRWTLFDLFVVLIIAVAMGRLFGLAWGALAVVTLGLGWLESGVPQYSWLVALAAEAVFRVLPEGKLRWLVKVGRLGAWAALVIFTVAFSVQHIREGMYPALAQTQSLGGVMSFSEYSNENAAQYQRAGSAEATKWKAPGKARSFNVRDFDRNATVQTGPGLPRWQWQAISIHFSGAVQRDQRLSFWLLGPRVNLVLSVLQVLLLGVLVLCVLGFPGGFWPLGLRRWLRRAPAAATVLLLALGAPSVAQAQEESGEPPTVDQEEVEVPAPAQSPPKARAPKRLELDSKLLEQLRVRLLEQPECAPSCASSPRLLLEAAPHVLRLRLEVLSGAETAVPLPGSAQQWVPQTVVLDGRAAPGLRRQPDGTLWLAVGPGVHQVMMEGPLPPRETVQLALPLRSYRVEAKLDGWKLDGLHEDGVADENLQLTRQATGGAKEGASLQGGTLPPFVRVERTVVLGLKWTVETTVRRVTPTGNAVVLEVPLLPGESVTTSDVRVQGGTALVNMPASVTEVSWSSVLDAKPPLELTAPKALSWFEVWRLEVSPVWHVTLGGIPVVHQQDASGVRLPEWRPWPEEHVRVDIVRPEALEGQTLTVDQSSLTVSPGARATDVTFTANFRSSRGGLHPFTLPEGASLQDVTINGAQQPIRQEGQTVAIPLVPGSQSVALSWRETGGMTTSWRTPALDVGTPTVNANLEVRVPSSRWVLLVGGPGLGPAVLFWSFLLVLLLVSVGLGRAKWTPLAVRHWVLLALGLSQAPIPAIGFVFAWLLFVAWREKELDLGPAWFDLRQLAMVAGTVVALGILGVSVYDGLLGELEMQVRGNGSDASLLRWFQDRTVASYPTAWVLSAPMLVYRGAMLLWSLWMALSLVKWLKWGWVSFSAGGLWRRSPKVVRPPPQPRSPTGHGGAT